MVHSWKGPFKGQIGGHVNNGLRAGREFHPGIHNQWIQQFPPGPTQVAPAPAVRTGGCQKQNLRQRTDDGNAPNDCCRLLYQDAGPHGGLDSRQYP